MAARVAPGDVQPPPHFISASPGATAPLEEEPVRQADRLVGGPDAVLVIDDTALVKQGQHSVGVARQYGGQLGKRASCRVLVALTPARHEVPVCLGLRLFLPRRWAEDRGWRTRAGVPEVIAGHPKWRIALDGLDRGPAAGATFGCLPAEAGYGKAAEFRQGLPDRGPTWAAGVLPTPKVGPAEVTIAPAAAKATGRRAKHPVPAAASEGGRAVVAALPALAWRTLAWRRGTKGELKAAFAALRVADGPLLARAQQRPGDEAWLAGERRAGGERRRHLTNRPAATAPAALAAAIKARRACGQAHPQMKAAAGAAAPRRGPELLPAPLPPLPATRPLPPPPVQVAE